ncbi:DUF4430 domain-containing protein [Patescibacteria group bacterium]|nr:DUF4430 domain-containing protein [Patescibacteria group bacterium]MBU0964132.1 DUF4430 domain-containing protein [Patescibacteria group bacterium]
MKKETNLFYIAIVVVAMAISITVFSAGGSNAEIEFAELSKKSSEVQAGRSGQVAGVAVEEAKMTIFREHGNSISMKFEVKKDMVVLEALETVASEFGLDVQTKDFNFGMTVEGIGELIGGQDDKYWLYYVNGEMPLVAVDQQEVAGGDEIEFKFEASPF